MSEVEITIVSHPGADDPVLKRCHALREEVFVVEQEVSREDEWDDLDGTTVHLLAHIGDDDLGTARLFMAEGKAKAQRVAVVARARKKQIGKKLMLALEACAKDAGHDEVTLGAQLTAIPFYERIDYEAFGPEFDDAGIPHRMMRKRL